MQLRSKFTVLALSAGLAVAGLAGPAQAATTGNTTTTFTLTAGVLAITVPASQALGSVATGAATTASVQLGSVSVADGRGALLGAWTTSVTSSDYLNTTTNGGTANETIVKANAEYWSGAATSTSGVGTFTPGQALVANKVALDVSRTAFAASVVVGNNTAAWNPTVSVTIPAAAVAGAYSGTITHSVG